MSGGPVDAFMSRRGRAKVPPHAHDAADITGLTSAIGVFGGNIVAGTIEADKLNVNELAAITASMGDLSIDGTLTLAPGGSIVGTNLTITSDGDLSAVNASISGSLVLAASSKGAAFPTSPDEGMLFFRTDLKRWYWYDGTSPYAESGWISLDWLDDNGRIDLNLITADRLNVDQLDAVTANMGTLTIDEALVIDDADTDGSYHIREFSTGGLEVYSTTTGYSRLLLTPNGFYLIGSSGITVFASEFAGITRLGNINPASSGSLNIVSHSTPHQLTISQYDAYDATVRWYMEDLGVQVLAGLDYSGSGIFTIGVDGFDFSVATTALTIHPTTGLVDFPQGITVDTIDDSGAGKITLACPTVEVSPGSLDLQTVTGDIRLRARNAGAAAANIALYADDAAGTERQRVVIDGDGDLTVYANDGTAALTVGDIGVAVEEVPFSLGSASELTISSGGSITVTRAVHTVDTYGDAATDDLDTITAGVPGQIVVLSSAAAARDVTLKDGTGNLNLAGDFTLSSTADRIVLIAYGATWYELCRSDNQ